MPASMFQRFEHLIREGHLDPDNFSTVIDIGVGAAGTEFLIRPFFWKDFICIEPNRSLEDRISRFYPKDRTQIIFKALSNFRGTTKLRMDPRDVDKASLFEFNHLSPSGVGQVSEMMVEVDRLDDLRKEFAYSGPYLIKIDSEGSELDIIESASEILLDTAYLILEINFMRRYEGSYAFVEMIGALRDAGFQAVDIIDEPPRTLDTMPIRRVDMLFVREDLTK